MSNLEDFKEQILSLQAALRIDYELDVYYGDLTTASHCKSTNGILMKNAEGNRETLETELPLGKWKSQD